MSGKSKFYLPINYSGDIKSSEIRSDLAKGVFESNIPLALNTIRDKKKQLLMDEGRLLEKGLSSNDPDVLIKAQQYWEDVQKKQDSGVKTQLVDPYEFRDSLGFKTKPTALGYSMLRRMARTPLIRSVITTRQTQVAEFATPQTTKFTPGFIIQKKKKYFSDEEEKVTPEDREEMDRIARFLLNGGDEENSWHGDTFESFLKKITNDSLELDQATAEVVRNNFGKPVEYLATDGATFRLANYEDDEMNQNKPEKRGYPPMYAQVIDGEVVHDYYPWELMFGIRNSTTNIYSNGYGESELEVLVQIITWMLYSDQYNGNFFSQGASPKGFLKISGNVNTNRIQEFRQKWMSMVSGVMNSHKVPIIESDNMEFVNLQQKNSDMEFSQWQEYLLKVVCAVYKISPEELGFAVKTSGGLGDGGNANDSKVKYSRDKGLKPLLRNIEFWINKWIVNALNKDFELKFVGIDIDTEKEELEMDVKRIANYMTPNEIRAKQGLDPIEGGDIILNSVYMQAKSMDAMAGDQAESDAAAGEEGGGVWDNIDGDDNDFEFEEPDTEKGIGGIPMSEDPFINDLNMFAYNLMNEKSEE